MNPLFVEDLLNPPFSEAWMALKRSTRIPILTGEKLEMVRGLRTFPGYPGGGHRRIPIWPLPEESQGPGRSPTSPPLTRTPVALHNVGSLVLTFANAHFGASIQNFYRSESALGRANRYVENMAVSNPPEVRKSQLKVPTGPGLGLHLNMDFLKRNLADGEEWWG